MSAPETYYDVAMRRLDEQMDRIGALDTKAASALGAAAALVPIFGALFAAFDENAPTTSVALYAVAFALYFAMIYCAVRGSRVKDWDLRPDLATLAMHALHRNEPTLKMWVADECGRSIQANEPRLDSKAVYVDLSLAGLVLVTLFLSAAALLQLLE